jgi:hypothetical protein
MASQMKVNRYITGLLLLCFSVFLGHNLVPHDHLSEISCTPFADTCPSKQGDQTKHERQNEANTNSDSHHAHCHAFNDVILEKFSPLVYNPEPVQWHPILIPGPESVADISLLLTPNLFPFYWQSCSSSSDIRTQALRAPPVFG